MNEKLAAIGRSKKFQFAVISGLSAAGGVIAGFAVAEKKYAAIAKQEIEEAKQFYSALNKKDDYSTPEKAAETLGLSVEAETELREAAVALQTYQGIPIPQVTVKELGVEPDPATQMENAVEVIKNVFTDAKVIEEIEDDGPEDTSKPHLITSEEFMENEVGHTQVTVTYFTGDDVVADARDEAMNDVDDMIGNLNLNRFGQKSGDPNAIYVRNFAFGMDFEVLRSRGKYTEEVLGFMEHSDSRHKIRRFRGDDE